MRSQRDLCQNPIRATVRIERYTTEQLLGPLNDVERKNAPKELFLAGDRQLLLEGARVSVVGSRRASEEGRDETASLARALTERNVVVVSGLAAGIDTVAHEIAIEAGGRTIAALGTPLDQVYPPENRALQARIIQLHLAISQFPPGSRGGRERFPMRNRTMALLSDATVIVEAGESSGSLHQGWEAIRLGRPLFLIESLLRRRGLGWPKEMLSYGAQVLSPKTLEPFFEMLPEGNRGDRARLTL
ncbi:MAG TPA: DNA-processing protein DprA [Planctomycetota bacterium]|nr:DNA-processing protein DprA [Planctomycetota bacterium]